jgi:hypothetical protein
MPGAGISKSGKNAELTAEARPAMRRRAAKDGRGENFRVNNKVTKQRRLPSGKADGATGCAALIILARKSEICFHKFVKKVEPRGAAE